MAVGVNNASLLVRLMTVYLAQTAIRVIVLFRHKQTSLHVWEGVYTWQPPQGLHTLRGACAGGWGGREDRCSGIPAISVLGVGWER